MSADPPPSTPTPSDPAPDHSGDLGVLARIFQIGLVVAFVLALGGAFLPGTLGQVSVVGMMVVLIGAPVLRVAWLTVDWAREGDRLFVVLGLVLLAVLATSGVVGFL